MDLSPAPAGTAAGDVEHTLAVLRDHLGRALPPELRGILGEWLDEEALAVRRAIAERSARRLNRGPQR
jgi:hypothetical protein